MQQVPPTARFAVRVEPAALPVFHQRHAFADARPDGGHRPSRRVADQPELLERVGGNLSLGWFPGPGVHRRPGSGGQRNLTQQPAYQANGAVRAVPDRQPPLVPRRRGDLACAGHRRHVVGGEA